LYIIYNIKTLKGSYSIYIIYIIGDRMTEVILGSLAALAIRDIVYEAVARYNHYRRHKDFEVFVDLLEDIDADEN